jgi:uncharacterized protein with beta-barrel porin domain
MLGELRLAVMPAAHFKREGRPGSNTALPWGIGINDQEPAMLVFRAFLRGSLALCLLLGGVGPVWAVDLTNPVGSTIPTMVGSPADDNYVNQGTVTGDVDMTQGGKDTFDNSGQVGGNVLMGGGNATVTNSGTVGLDLLGNLLGTGNTSITNTVTGVVTGNLLGSTDGAGSVTIVNNGSVGGDLVGNDQSGATPNALVNNTVNITNTGSVAGTIYGNYTGTGDVTITNTVTGVVNGDLLGITDGAGSVTIVNNGLVGGDVVGNDQCGCSPNVLVNNPVNITNTGTVSGNIFGNDGGTGNVYINNSGTVGSGFGGAIYGNFFGFGNVSIVNSGTVNGDVIGNFGGVGNSNITNSGTITGDLVGQSGGTGDVIINNSGTVGGDLIGVDCGCSSSGNSFITNSGSVGGSIFAGPGNDTVVVVGGSSVGGYVDGEEGNNTLGLNNMGTVDYSLWGPNSTYRNFQNIAFYGGSTTLTGNWNLGSGTTTVNSGTFNLPSGSSLTTSALTIYGGGTANIYGVCTVSGATTVGGTLNVNSGGTLTTGTLGINSGGTANIYGTTNVGGATTVGGTLNVGGGGTLTTGTLGINSGGTATIGGTVTVTGNTLVNGALNVASGGTLTTDSLGIGQGGLVDIGGTLSTNATDCSGLLHVNGILNSSTVVIRPSGLLWGSGDVNGYVTILGTVAPGNSIGTLNVHGSLVFMPGSVYQAEISSGGTSDRISVDGPVIINGGRILTALPRALYKDRFAWSLLSATGGISGAFEGVDGQPKSQTLSLHAVTYSDHVGLEVWRAPFAGFGGGPGTRELGAGLDGLIPLAVGRKDDLASLIYNMDWSYDRAQIQTTLKRLSPEMYTSYGAAGVDATTIFDRALRRRMDESRSARQLGLAEAPQGEGLLMAASEEAAPLAQPVTPGPEMQGWSFWGGGLGSLSSQAGTDGRLGYRQRLGGLAGGVDGRLFPWLTVGLGVGASKGDLDWGQTYLSGGLKGLHTGLYAGIEAGGLHGQASLAYSQYDANGRRSIDLPDLQTQAIGDFKAQAGLARLSGGYDWRLGNWLAGPTAGLRYVRMQQDGFRESGAGFLGLQIDDSQGDWLNSSLGLQASSKLELGGLQMMPSLSLEWQHEYKGGAPEVTARFPGYEDAPFRVTGQAAATDLAVMQAGVTARVRDRLSAYTDFGLGLAQGYNSQTVSLGLQYSF